MPDDSAPDRHGLESPGDMRRTLTWASEADAEGIDRRAAELVAAIEGGAEAVHVDLRGVTVLDPRELGVLVGASRLARGHGIPLTFSTSSAQVRTALEHHRLVDRGDRSLPAGEQHGQAPGASAATTPARVATYCHGMGMLASMAGPLTITDGWITIGDCPVVFRADDVDWDGQRLRVGHRAYALGDLVDVGGGWTPLDDLRTYARRLSVPDHWEQFDKVFAAG